MTLKTKLCILLPASAMLMCAFYDEQSAGAYFYSSADPF